MPTRYEDACGTAEAAFRAVFTEAGWKPEQLDFVDNPKPEKSPYCFMPAAEAARYKGQLGSIEGPFYLKELLGTTPKAILAGKLVIDASQFPPQLLKYPRIGSFEVTYQLCDDGAPIGQRLVYSKLAVDKWPNNQKLAKSILQRVQLDLLKQRQAFQSHARRSFKLAEEQRVLVAKAEEAANKENEDVVRITSEVRGKGGGAVDGT